MRMINNAVPNFAWDDPNDVDLSPVQADNLVRYQLGLAYQRYLDELSFFLAGIVDTESQSKKVHKALIKNKIILPIPESESSNSANEGVQMPVNTAGVTKGFASQLAIISVHAQRKLVGMLFFWEEECMRWKLLDAEEKDILSALENEDGNRDLAVALEAVELKKKLLPSQRGERTENVGEGRGHELPAYN